MKSWSKKKKSWSKKKNHWSRHESMVEQKKQRLKYPTHRTLTLGNTRMTGTPFFAQQITGGQVNAVGMRVVAVFNVHGPNKVHISQLVTFQTGLLVGFMNADIVWIATTG